MNDEASQIVSTTILQQFPTAPEGFAVSLASKLLKRFPLFFLFLPSDGLSDIPDTATIRSLRQDTETVHGVLDALSRFQLNDDSLDEERPDEDLDDAEIRFVVKRKGQSKKNIKKQAKRGRRVSPADYKTIESFGLDVPRNSAELCRQTTFLLESQMETLKVSGFISTRFDPFVADVCPSAVSRVVPYSDGWTSHQTTVPSHTRCR